MRSISYWSKRFVSVLAAGSLVGCAHQYAPEASWEFGKRQRSYAVSPYQWCRP